MKSSRIIKYDYIDALRGYAILGVVALHSYFWVMPSSGILARIAREGGMGVQLFFIASALTLFMSIRLREQAEAQPWLAFYIRRFFRIAPMFYLAIIVYWGSVNTQYWAPNGTEWWHVLLTVGFMHGWHPETINSVVPGGWTIAVEMTFYLCIPFLFHKLRSVQATIAALLLSLMITTILSRGAEYVFAPLYPQSQQYLVSFFAESWFFSQLPVFIIGILVYHVTFIFPHRDAKAGILLLMLAMYLFAAFLGVETFANLLPHHVMYSLALAVFALSLHFHPAKILVNPIIVLIGKLSFSIYLVHFMVLHYLKEFLAGELLGNTGFLVAFLLVITISSCISFFTHKYIELPGMALGKRLIQRL